MVCHSALLSRALAVPTKHWAVEILVKYAQLMTNALGYMS